jgi:hypothetical protein
MELIGRAEDGACVMVLLTTPGDPSRALAEVATRWPPRGLVRIAGNADLGDRAMPSRHLALTVSPDGSAEVAVDGRPAPGGWDRLESELGLFAAERLDGLVAVHAALIVWEGAAIVVPGPSYSGKTTLCVAAIEIGATVWSDEFTLVDPDSGRVLGWPRPLRIRTSASPERRALDDAGAPPPEPLPVGVVAPVRYGQGVSSLAPISRGEAVMEILANTVCGESRPQESFRAALAMTHSARLIGGHRGDAAVTMAELLETCAGSR